MQVVRSVQRVEVQGSRALDESPIHLYRRKIRDVAIVYRRGTPAALATAKDLVTWLTERKLKVWSHPTQRLTNAKPTKDAAKLDLVIALGGDGFSAIRMKRLHRAFPSVG